MADALPGVVHDDGQLVGIQSVLASHHEISCCCAQRGGDEALDLVGKLDMAGRGNGNPGGSRPGKQPLTLAAVAAAGPIGAQQGAAAVTGKQVACRGQLFQCGGVGGAALTLEQDVPVPVQAVALQAVEDARGRACFLAGRIEVFHAHQPAAAVMTGVEKTRQGGQQ